MTDKQKQVIREMRGQGLSFKAVADVLSLSHNTVKSFCYRENLMTSDDSPGDRNDDGDHCKNCGAVLNHRPGIKRKFFCNDKCRYTWWNRQRIWNKNAYRLVCQSCGNEFVSYGNKNRKYCGRECYIRSRYREGLP